MDLGARKHWIDLLAVGTTMIVYFVLITMACECVDYTPFYCEIRILVLLGLIFGNYFTYMSGFDVPLMKNYEAVLFGFVSVLNVLYAGFGTISSTQMIIREEPQELDAPGILTWTIELYLYAILLFYSIRMNLHILVH